MRLLRREIEMIGCSVCGKPRRPRLELKRGGSRAAVKPGIFEQHIRRPLQPAGRNAATLTPLTADLEEVGKVIAEQQGQIKARGMFAMILNADALVGGAAPEKDRA